MISFAAIAPHPPLLLPSVGSEADRKKVKKTWHALEDLAGRLKDAKPGAIIISSPHPDWGFNVPLYFLARDFKGEVKTIMTGAEPAREHFEKGREYASGLAGNKHFGFIASGDLSHVLTKDGPYGFHPEGPKFDEALLKYLEEKNLDGILNLDNEFPEAAECGLRSFAFMLGALETSGAGWKTDILSYEGPFGVGYLVAQLL